MGAGRRFGRLAMRDDRDAGFRIRREKAAKPRTSRYWNANGWWGDQGATPRCVAFAWAHWLEDAPVTHAGPAPIVDPAALYAEAQKLDEWYGENYDGTSVRAGAKALQKRGWIAEYRWAKQWDDIEYALLNVGPLVVGTVWTLGMSEPDGNGRIRVVGPEAGGHAYVLNGINLKSGLLRLKNSWGPEYGRGGHAYVSIEEWTGLFDLDGEACLAVENPDPTARVAFPRGRRK